MTTPDGRVQRIDSDRLQRAEMPYMLDDSPAELERVKAVAARRHAHEIATLSYPAPGLRDELAEADYMRRRAFTTHTWDELPKNSKDWWREQNDWLLPVVEAHVAASVAQLEATIDRVKALLASHAAGKLTINERTLRAALGGTEGTR